MELVNPSSAPADRRASAIARKPSMSVKNLMKTSVVETPVVSPSPTSGRPLNAEDAFMALVDEEQGPNRGAGGSSKLNRSPSVRFAEAMEDGSQEGHLMTRYGMMKRYLPRFFVLNNGFLRHYDKKSDIGTKKRRGWKKETMELTVQSMARKTMQHNCFRVRTGTVDWIMMAKNKKDMDRWVTAINCQINALFVKEYNVPEDDYGSHKAWGQSLYKMADGVDPQWVRCYPFAESPQTGDGLFAGEVIEVEQEVTIGNSSLKFLRMANERGWTCVTDTNPGGGGKEIFTKISGLLREDLGKYTVPMMTSSVLELFGPSLESQETGAFYKPGDKVRAVQKFTPSGPGPHISFLKLKAKGRGGSGGWLPIMRDSSVPGVVEYKRR